MPPRPNKRQLREREELEALALTRHEDAESDESASDTPLPTRSTGAGFAALMTPMEDDAESVEEEGTRRASKTKKARELSPFASRKKKKKTAASEPVLQESPITPGVERGSPSPGPSKKERKALKKQKAKEKKDVDDVDKALAELSIKYPDLKQLVASTNVSPATRSAFQSLAALLSVSLQHLDSEAEMRRFFGAKVISAAKASASGSSSTPRRQVTQKSNLTRPQSNWWAAQYREGLSSRLLTAEDNETLCHRHGWQPLVTERWWTVEYSKKYRGVTLAFMQTVMSGDPEGFWQILKLLPYHADTLLQLSEVYFHREEHSTAADFIDRALFTYERAFVGSFKFTSGLNRLDFDRVENRPFFLAIHRQVTDLQRRGCVRTAFEFAKLLYSLDPWTDPHGSLLHLDYLALKAGMTQWVLDIWDLFSAQGEGLNLDGRLRVTVLPGWAYARALALHMSEKPEDQENHPKSTNALRDAIIAFPSVVPLLADKADISLSRDVREHTAFRIYTDASSLRTESAAILHLLSHLYAQRSSSLWKIQKHSSWFAKTVTESLSSLSPSYDNTSPAYQGFTELFSKPQLACSVYRHAVVLEASCRHLFGFIPRHVTNAKHLACDPLPPPTRVNEYDSEFFKGAEDALAVRPRSRRANERMLERLVPDPAFRRQLQEFFEAHPNFAQRFPGGLLQFAQVAAQLPEEILEDMMIAEVAGHTDGGAMPGQLLGQEVLVDLGNNEEQNRHNQPAAAAPVGHDNSEGEEEDEADTEDESTEDVSPLPVRLLRNVMARFWGGSNPAEESSDDSNDDRHDIDLDVD